MKNVGIIFLIFCASITSLFSQDQESKTSISKSLDVYIFPPEGVDEETKKTDEYNCYLWAVDESGVNPFEGIDVKPADTGSDKPDGSAIKGAARGAAVGAAIGGITGDAGEGAAIGSIMGATGGLRAGRARKGAKKQQAEQAAAAEEQKMLENFKKAFSVCLEAKGYTVKI